MLVRLLLALAPLAAWAQAPCPPVPAYSPCDLVFELDDAEAAAHRAPYQTVQLRAEVKSPRFKTYLLPAFWDGGRRLVIRFAPTEAGAWDYMSKPVDTEHMLSLLRGWLYR